MEKILYSAEQIAEAVARTGAEITRDYKGKTPLVVGILKGSFVFMADLVRCVDLPCEIEFMAAQSYGRGTTSSGVVRITKDIDTDIAGRDVIIVEDILDTGNTLNSVCEVLRARNPASLRLCVFLDKKIARKVPLEADYACFEVGNEFVIGYGLDYAEKYRNLKDLKVLGEENA
jgi:hypoxanthine phosphoribosyltransferase